MTAPPGPPIPSTHSGKGALETESGDGDHSSRSTFRSVPCLSNINYFFAIQISGREGTFFSLFLDTGNLSEGSAWSVFCDRVISPSASSFFDRALESPPPPPTPPFCCSRRHGVSRGGGGELLLPVNWQGKCRCPNIDFAARPRIALIRKFAQIEKVGDSHTAQYTRLKDPTK